MGNFDGTYVGGCTLGVPGVVANETAVGFDGATCTVDLGDNFKFLNQAPFSIEAWVRTNALAGNFGHLFSKEMRTSAPVNGYAMVFENPTSVYVERAVSSKNQRTNDALVTTGVFTHVVATYDGVNQRVYVDGKATAAVVADSASLMDVAESAFIGSAGASNFFKGDIDEVAVYDKALTPTQVATHHDAAAK